MPEKATKSKDIELPVFPPLPLFPPLSPLAKPKPIASRSVLQNSPKANFRNLPKANFREPAKPANRVSKKRFCSFQNRDCTLKQKLAGSCSSSRPECHPDPRCGLWFCFRVVRLPSGLRVCVCSNKLLYRAARHAKQHVTQALLTNMHHANLVLCPKELLVDADAAESKRGRVACGRGCRRGCRTESKRDRVAFGRGCRTESKSRVACGRGCRA